MASERNIEWLIAQALLLAYQAEVAWTVQESDSIPAMTSASIRIRQSSPSGWDEEIMQNDPQPGLIITMPDIQPNASGGDVDRDDNVYQFLLQLIYTNPTPDQNLATLSYWRQQIRRRAMHKKLDSVAEVNRMWVQQVQSINEKAFTRHFLANSMFLVSVEARENRDIEEPA